MLTNDLLRFEIGPETIKPRYLKRRHASTYLKIAEDLIRIYRSHLGKTHGELDDALSDYESHRVGYKILRGLAKILDGYSEYQPPDDVDYPGFRQHLFEFVEKYRPIVHHPDLVHDLVRETVLEKFANEYGPLPNHLYGDLPTQQVLAKIDLHLTPEDLIRRYNLALAQGILYRCQQMTIRIWDGYKTVFHYLKLAQLIHKIHSDDEAYVVEIDGPFSLFHRTQKYGVNLARFLPGLLLAQKWEMRAVVNTGKGQRYFLLNQNCGLKSHYRKSHPFDSSVEEAFFKNFKKRKTAWDIHRESAILDLGDTVLIPDFKLIHPAGTEVLLEIVGFWTPEYLEKKIDKLKRYNQNDLIVAVNEKLNCSKTDFHGPVIFYKTRLKVKDVLEILPNDLNSNS